MRAPAKPKPRAADEVARVVRIATMLYEESNPIPTAVGGYPLQFGPDTKVVGPTPDALLEVAERIAARTEG